MFPAETPKMAGKAWPDGMRGVLGPQGVEFVEALLVWDPARRVRLGREVLEHKYLTPERMSLGGYTLSLGGWTPGHESSPCGFGPGGFGGLGPAAGGFEPVSAHSFEGHRHHWNVLQGEMAAEVLSFLQGDPALSPVTEEHGALRLSFTAKTGRKDARCEAGRKMVISGYLGQCGTSSSSGMDQTHPLPLRRTQAWVAAWKHTNAATLAAMLASCRRRLGHMSKEKLGANGKDFLKRGMEEWCLTSGELAFTRPGSGDDLWAEPEHLDGGASVLHMGVTLYGRRHVRCEQRDGLPEIFVPCKPGSVYVAGMTGPKHQVYTGM